MTSTSRWPVLFSVLATLGYSHAGPCDIYASGGTPCVAAHSTTRSLYSDYNGALYQVQKTVNGGSSTKMDIHPLSTGGVANAASQDSFCQGASSCLISIIYDQSGRGNHLTQAPPGGQASGPDPGGYDALAVASAAPITVGGHKAYGVYIPAGTGYRNDKTSGIATGNDPEGIYAVVDGTHFNNGCCWDYGNAETSNKDTGNAHMETIYFGVFGNGGSGSGPWVQADLENGIFPGSSKISHNQNNPSQTSRFVTAVIKGDSSNLWSIRGGNAQSGALGTYYSGPRASGYYPMMKEGAIVLGVGGDNSNKGVGTFYEGVLTSGYPSDQTENSVQANIVSAKYST